MLFSEFPLLISFEMEQYSVQEGDGHVQVCVQLVKLSSHMEGILWENISVTIATAEDSAVGKHIISIFKELWDVRCCVIESVCWYVVLP